MRRLIAIGAVALLVLAAVPLANAGTTPLTRHVDGSVVVSEPAKSQETVDRTWLARFEVRTTTAGAVQFGYFELFGVGGAVLGQIHEFTVEKVDYYKTGSGAQGATLQMRECIVEPPTEPCFDSPYQVSDGGNYDTFMTGLGWTVTSGQISIYSTGGQNGQ